LFELWAPVDGHTTRVERTKAHRLPEVSRVSNIARQAPAGASVNGDEHTNSVRKFQSLQENMTRLHGEIERMTYAAEIACRKDCYDGGFSCPFWRGMCILPKVRELIGE
jgi:hypothetical protein